MAKTYKNWSEQYFDADQHTQKEKRGILGMARTAVKIDQIKETVMEAIWIGDNVDDSGDVALAREVLVGLGLKKLCLVATEINESEYKARVVPILLELSAEEGVLVEDMFLVAEIVPDYSQQIIDRLVASAVTYSDWEQVWIFAPCGSEQERLAKQKLEEFG